MVKALPEGDASCVVKNLPRSEEGSPIQVVSSLLNQNLTHTLTMHLLGE